MACSACERFIRVPDLGFGLRLGIWVQDLGFGLQGSQNVGLRGTEEVDGIIKCGRSAFSVGCRCSVWRFRDTGCGGPEP